MTKEAPRAELYSEINGKDGYKEGWNIVTGCCQCNMRRTEQNQKEYPGEVGTCILIKPHWPLPYVPCCRSKCPVKLRLLIDANAKQPFGIYSADKPTLWWRFKKWLSR